MEKQTKPSWEQNTFVPAMSVCDEIRRQWFTSYNVDLMNEIRRIKLNQDGKERDSNK